MRRTAALLAVAFAATGLAAVTAAEAQPRRPRTITVTPRSFLDAGVIVPQGTYLNYVLAERLSPPVYENMASRFGEDTLPPRIGAGPNPFPKFFIPTPDVARR